MVSIYLNVPESLISLQVQNPLYIHIENKGQLTFPEIRQGSGMDPAFYHDLMGTYVSHSVVHPLRLLTRWSLDHEYRVGCGKTAHQPGTAGIFYFSDRFAGKMFVAGAERTDIYLAALDPRYSDNNPTAGNRVSSQLCHASKIN